MAVNCVSLLNSVALGTNFVNVLEDGTTLSATKCTLKNLVVSNIQFMTTFTEVYARIYRERGTPCEKR